MSNSVYRAPPLSWAHIDSVAASVRSFFNLQQHPYFPIMDIIEDWMDLRLNWLTFQVAPREEMGDMEGCLCPDGTYMRLREDVYEAALNGDGRARFTAAHELGHYALHARQPLARAASGQVIKPYENSERQADYFAASLLMPAEFCNPIEGANEVVQRHGVSFSAAENRLRYLRGRVL